MPRRVTVDRHLLVRLCFVLASLALVPALTRAVDSPPAATDPYGLNQTYQKGFDATPPQEDPNEPLLAKTMGLILNWFMGLLGFIFLMLIIHGGIAWMTAGGNEERVEKAQKQINTAIAGLIVTFISYALAEAIITALASAASEQSPLRNSADPRDT